jgi:hypothetical protein
MFSTAFTATKIRNKRGSQLWRELQIINKIIISQLLAYRIGDHDFLA